MKKLLIISCLLLISSFAFSQSFEGKLTYLFKNTEQMMDTNMVFIRGDSIRIDLVKRLNVSTYLYFVKQNVYHAYSKRDQTYSSYPIIQPDAPKEVLVFDLKENKDSITLFYHEKSLNLNLNIETTTKAILKLHPKLPVPFFKGTYVEPYVLNGSGYIAQQINIDLYFDVMNAQRSNQRWLIQVDYTKPDIELFELKQK